MNIANVAHLICAQPAGYGRSKPVGGDRNAARYECTVHRFMASALPVPSISPPNFTYTLLL